MKVTLSFKSVLNTREVWGIFLGYFCYGYVWYLYITWLPSYLYEHLHFSIRDTGWWSGFSYLGLAIITLLSGWAADEFIVKGRSESKVRNGFIKAGFLIGSLICLVPFVHNQTANAILLFIVISGMGLATANTWAITQSLAQEGTVGTLSSIQNFGATFGGVIAPVLTGYIISWTKPYSIPFMLAGFIMLVGIFSYTVIIRELKPISFKTI